MTTALDQEAREADAAAEGASATGKRTYVQRIFSEIAPRYDLLNRLLSLGIDRRWRKVALERLNWRRVPQGVYLDLCAGTLDVGTELTKRPAFAGRIVGADFAQADAVLDLEQRARQFLHHSAIAAQDMQCQALRRFLAEARHPLEESDQARQKR